MSLRVSQLPKVSPIILVERPLPFDDPDWLFEPKFDGFRVARNSDRSGWRWTGTVGVITS
jgi:ATP-dependent DNA ligase